MNTRNEVLAVFFLATILSMTIGCGSGGDSDKPDRGEKSIATTSSGAEAPDSSNTGSSEKAQTSDAKPKVAIETNLGTVIVLLYPEKAEITVQNFLQYVDEGHYDGTVFHDVSKDIAIIGGGYTKDMQQKKERHPIRNEAHNGLKNVRGTIAMVRKPDVIDSATCQFMFNLADNDFLDHKDREKAETYGYCVFGKVIEGMDVVDKIGAQQVKEVKVPDGAPFTRVPAETVTISSIRRIK
ncbi:MAG: peptidylprolyl isomerase [Pirellulales bacterium]|nr:peptidylprolyl isomerase [Pirellulales bacterium]